MDSRFLRFFTALIGLVVAGYLAFQIISDYLGPFTAVLRFIGIGLMIVAALNPREGMLIVFAELCYADLLKRLAVYIDGPDFSITLQLLAIPAITVALIAAVTLWKAFHDDTLRTRHVVMLGFIAILGAVLVFTFREQNGLMGSLKNATNIAGYATIILMIDIHCKSYDEIIKLVRQFLWILVPAALYTLYQARFGFQPFEIYYAKTGFTITASETLSDSPRAFGTFSGVSATMIYASAGAFALWLAWNFRKRRLASLLIAAALIAAMIAARGRAAWVVFALTLLAYPMMLGWKRVVTAYTLGLLATFSLFWFSPYLYDNLPTINGAWLEIVNPENRDELKTFSILTMSDRLIGLKTLRESTGYTWTGRFGNKIGLEDANSTKEYGSHDGINQVLLELGILGLLLCIAFLVFATLYAHKRILSCGDPQAIRIGAICMAFLSPFIAANLLTGSTIHVTPINFWMFTLIGTAFTAARLAQEPKEETPLSAPAETIHSPRAGVELTKGSPV